MLVYFLLYRSERSLVVSISNLSKNENTYYLFNKGCIRKARYGIEEGISKFLFET